MVDVHCHLEQEDFDKDRQKVIGSCREKLKSIITCCCHPRDFDLTLDLVKRYKNFIFGAFSIHPEYIKEISEEEIEDFFKKLRENKENITGIGETGLDYIIEEAEFREKQKDLFLKFIQLAEDLGKPLITHSRRAFFEVVEILEERRIKSVLMHFFTAEELLPKIMENGWFISVNTTLLNSKKIKRIVEALPLEKILTETDSPWLGGEGKRNSPLTVKSVIEGISEIKRMRFEEVDRITTQNAIEFFKLPIS